MGNIERRIDRLEKHEEPPPEGYTTMYMCYGVRDPTEEQIEAARKKFLDEHPGYLERHSMILLPLCEEEQIIAHHEVQGGVK